MGKYSSILECGFIRMRGNVHLEKLRNVGPELALRAE